MREILIIEDREDERSELRQLVNQIDAGAVVYETDSEEKAYAIAMKRLIDLFLVDIILHPQRPGSSLSGAVFAQNVRGVKKYRFTPIIFVTGIADPQLNLLNIVRRCSIIRKPYNRERMKSALFAALHFHTEDISEKRIFFRSDGALESVPATEIIYADSFRRRLHIEAVHQEFELSGKTCKSLFEDLNSDDFVWCRKGTVVNLNFIKKVDPVNRYIYLKMTQSVLEIGPTIKKTFMAELKERFPPIN